MPVTDNPPAYLPNNQQAYFFAEGGSITQSASQAFGPVVGNEAAEFRLTTKFSCAAPVKAYAICKGIVLIQPQTGTTDKVNLLLRPFKQPYRGLNIKYFVYRGLRKQDFFTNGSDPQITPAVSNVTSEFVKKINQDFDSFYSEPLYDQSGVLIPKPVFLAKYIGYNPQQPDATPISDLFFKESVLTATGGTVAENDAYELPLIDEGKWLGYFETGEGGIDVVLNYGDYKNDFDNSEFVFDLAYARAAEAKIVLTGTDGNKKLQREQVFQFFDAAAFYGLFADVGKIKLYTSGTAIDKTGNILYTDVLAPFATKNNWYLYIQSDRTRSYDYYGNYKIADGNTNNLKVGISETSLAETQYGTYGWPLLINNQQQQPVTDGRNRLYLQFVTDNNVNTVLYGQVGVIQNAQQNNFCNSDYLKLPADDEGNYGGLTKPLVISGLSFTDGSNIASLFIILYQGITYSYLSGTGTDGTGQTVDLYEVPNFFDDVFDAGTLITPIKSSGAKYIITTSERLKLSNFYLDSKQKGVAAIQTVVVEDFIETDDISNPELARVSYITEVVNIMSDSTSTTGAITQDTKTNSTSLVGASPDNVTYDLPEPYFYSIKPFTGDTTSVRGIELQTLDETIPVKVILGMTADENDRLKALIPSTATNPRLFLVDLYSNNSEFISQENIQYQKYKAGVVAEIDNKLKLLLPSEEVIVYSLDRKFHFTSLYSRYMIDKEATTNNLTLKTVE